MLLGYNTNGLAHHRLADALKLLAEIGYESVAITVDHHAFDPQAADLDAQLDATAELLAGLSLRCVVESGARYLLDPRVKHEPTLLSPDDVQRGRRIDFLQHCIDVAARLNADCVALWSGALRTGESDDVALDRLAHGLRAVLDYAEKKQVVLGFEPEPGMFVDTMARFQRLLQWVDHPALRLTIDLGHLHCQGETPIVDHLSLWADRIVNMHIEDMRAGVHEHLMFGEGEMDFVEIVDELAAIGYQGPLHVELSRHSHQGPQAASQAYDFLRPLIDAARS